MNKLAKDALVLTLITLISGIALGIVYEVTLDPIAKAQEAALQAAYRQVFADAASFEDLEDFDEEKATKLVHDKGYTDDDILNTVVALDNGGESLGYVITVVTHAGYGGDITLSLGITNDGTMNGYSITSISETAGLGMKATEEKFMTQFANIPLAVYEVAKDNPSAESPIEAISGATITSRAVTNAVNAGFTYFESLTGGEAK